MKAHQLTFSILCYDTLWYSSWETSCSKLAPHGASRSSRTQSPATSDMLPLFDPNSPLKVCLKDLPKSMSRFFHGLRKLSHLTSHLPRHSEDNGRYAESYKWCTGDANGPSAVRREPMTSSERGRAYRERMRRLETTLDADVVRLRRQVQELLMRRSIADTYSLQRRQHASGSLAKLVYKYYTLFQESMAALPPASVALMARHDPQAALDLETQYQAQARFLQHIMDPQVIAGDLVGPLAILDQWRRYAASHGSFRGHIEGITASGLHDNTIVTLHAKATGKITGATFYTLFPHAIGREDALIQRFLDREVTYNITNRYLFNVDGRIGCEIVEIGFIEGLLGAGATVSEVTMLMEGSMISKDCTLSEKTVHVVRVKPRPGLTPSKRLRHSVIREYAEDAGVRRVEHTEALRSRLGIKY